MIKEISKIKDLGIFHDFKWLPSLEFKRYNLIYGWNGSGKTTLTKLFTSLPTGFCEDFPEMGYEIETNDGAKYTEKNEFRQEVKVFNQDYISRNVRTKNEGARPIFIIGEESHKLSVEIDSYKKILYGDSEHGVEGKIPQRDRLTEEVDRDQKLIDTKLTSIASTISSVINDRLYRRPKASEALASMTDPKCISDKELTENRSIIAQTQLPAVPTVGLPEIFSQTAELILNCNQILETTIKAKVIDRLKHNDDLAVWVFEGLELHKKHSSDKCEFCESKIPDQRLTDLQNHFNAEDKKLRFEIDRAIQRLEEFAFEIEDVSIPAASEFYKSFQSDYSIESESLKEKSKKVDGVLQTVIARLEKKKNATSEKIKGDIDIDLSDLVASFSKLNGYIEAHNSMTKDLDKVIGAAKEKIKLHYLSTVYGEIRELQGKIIETETKKKAVMDGIEGDKGIAELQQLIDSNTAKISSAHKGCEEINKRLRNFLGRDDLQFVPKEENSVVVGYEITRSGQRVVFDISEGEKSAVAFAHFLAHLKASDFDLNKAIVVIDDPISSLDLNMLFRTCSLIETDLAEAEQLFVLTHNYDFFNQIKKWFENSYKVNSLQRGETLEALEALEARKTGAYFMVENTFDSQEKRRTANIAPLDPMLRDYESEYHFLFKKLLSFDRDNPVGNTLTIGAVYNYPNIARKCLECFLSFRVPKKTGMLGRLRGLEDDPSISSDETHFVYNFVNTHSHLDTKTGLIQFDPTLTLSCSESIKRVLALIKQADQRHYEAMEKSTSKNDSSFPSQIPVVSLPTVIR